MSRKQPLADGKASVAKRMLTLNTRMNLLELVRLAEQCHELLTQSQARLVPLVTYSAADAVAQRKTTNALRRAVQSVEKLEHAAMEWTALHTDSL